MTMDCLIDLLACFYSVFYEILHEDAANYAKCSFYLLQALVFHSMCCVPFAMHAFYWYETFYTSRIIILFRKIKCICLMAFATKSWNVGLFWCFLWYFKGESITIMWWHNIDWYPCNHRFDWNPCIYGTISNWLKLWTQRRAKSQFVTPVAFLMTLKENLLHCRLFYH